MVNNVKNIRIDFLEYMKGLSGSYSILDGG